MKISTATSVFRNFQIEDAIDHIIKAGFEGVDIWCGRPHIFRKDHSPTALKRLRKKLEENQLSPVCLMPAFYRYPFSLSSPMDVIRKDSIVYMKECIESALVMGAKQVLVVPDNSLYGQTMVDSRSRFMDSLDKVCDYADKKDMKLGIEIVYPKLSDYMGSTHDAMSVIQELGSGCLGVVLDTGHLNLSGEDVESALANLGSLVFQIHVNDNDQKQQQNAVPGEGNFDFVKFISLLRKYQYDGFLTLELGGNYTFDPYPPICEALKRVRGYVQASV